MKILNLLIISLTVFQAQAQVADFSEKKIPPALMDEYRKSALSKELFLSVDRSDLKVIERLIKSGVDVNVRNKHTAHNMNSLMRAALFGKKHVLKLLIGYGADVNARDAVGRTALGLAVRSGHKNITKLLIKYGSDVNVRDDLGRTPLMIAVFSRGKKRMLNLLIKNGADISIRSKIGSTLLMEAAYLGQKSIVNFLIKKNVDINARDHFGRTALDYAVHLGPNGLAKKSSLKKISRILIRNSARSGK